MKIRILVKTVSWEPMGNPLGIGPDANGSPEQFIEHVSHFSNIEFSQSIIGVWCGIAQLQSQEQILEYLQY